MLTSKGLLVTAEKELIIKIQIQLHYVHYAEGYECFDGIFLLSLFFSKIFDWRPFLLNLPLPKEEQTFKTKDQEELLKSLKKNW